MINFFLAKIAAETKKLLILILIYDGNFLDSHSIIEKFILKNQFIIKTITNNNSNNYKFINLTAAHETCDFLDTELVELLISQITKKYSDKRDSSITINKPMSRDHDVSART